MKGLARLTLFLPLLISRQAFALVDGAPLESEPSSARVTALGGAALAIDGGDAWQEAPASLVDRGSWSVSAHDQRSILDIERQSLEGTLTTPLGVFAAGFGYSSFGQLTARDEVGKDLGLIDLKRLSGSLAAAYSPWPKIDLGASAAAYQQSFGSASVLGDQAALSARWRYAPHASLSLAGGTHGLGLGTALALPWIESLHLLLQVSEPWSGPALFATGLEWQNSSPAPEHNFERTPIVTSGPYAFDAARDDRALHP